MKKLFLLWFATFSLSLITIGYTQEYLVSPIWVVNAFTAYYLIKLRKVICNDIFILLYSLSAILLASLLIDLHKNIEEKIYLCAISALQIWIFLKTYFWLSTQYLKFKIIVLWVLPNFLSALIGSSLFVIFFEFGETYLQFIDYFLEQFATGLSVVCLLSGMQYWKMITYQDYFISALALIVQYYISIDPIFATCLLLPLVIGYFSTRYAVRQFSWLAGLLTLICGFYITMPLMGEYWTEDQMNILSRMSAYRLSLSIYLIVFLLLCELYAKNHRLLATLARTTLTDELTGLKNRYALKNKTFEQGCIFLLDVDDFKKVNDEFGHYIGDLVLQHLASILKMCSPQSSLVSRWGGEEFLIVASNFNDAQAKTLCQQILDTCVAFPFSYQEIKLNITLSIGATCFKRMDHANTLYFLKRVDGCLYNAKAKGKNQFVFDPVKPLALNGQGE